MRFEDSTIAIVGASGAVGSEALSLLAARGHPLEQVIAVASARSVGKRARYGEDREIELQALDLGSLGKSDLAILALDAPLSRELAPQLVERGVLVVDNSSAFRMDPEVPLVVPEVNVALLEAGPRLVANPNCSAILLLVTLEALRREFGLERVVVSTYQAVSGAGQAAIDELRDQTRADLEGRELQPLAFPEPCAFNVFPHESKLDPSTGMNGEEEKLIRETRRVWQDDRIGLIPTCARVPAIRSHCQSVFLTLKKKASVDELKARLRAAPGVEYLDANRSGGFPTSRRASEQDSVLVGRLRAAPDEECDEQGRVRSFSLWLAGDQLRKGAALNALQIGEALLSAKS